MMKGPTLHATDEFRIPHMRNEDHLKAPPHNPLNFLHSHYSKSVGQLLKKNVVKIDDWMFLLMLRLSIHQQN